MGLPIDDIDPVDPIDPVDLIDPLENLIIGAIVETENELKASFTRPLTEDEKEHIIDVFHCYEVDADEFYGYLDRLIEGVDDLNEIYRIIDNV